MRRAAGFSPSLRLFEAAACGTPILSDDWLGFDSILDDGREALAALAMPDCERTAIGAAPAAELEVQMTGGRTVTPRRLAGALR